MKNLNWVLGGKMSLHTQRILSKWVQSEKNTSSYPKNNKQMGTERKNKSVYPKNKNEMGTE